MQGCGMMVSRREELFGERRVSLFGRMELRKSTVIRIREEVVCSWSWARRRGEAAVMY